jgi:phospholipid/cholesterol/gamma-HCH transport system substrate-binding protein
MLRSRAIREGTVGLFALLGLVIFSGLAIWLRGGGFGQSGYQFIVEFPDVSGLQIGALVRYRGVTVGKVTNLQPGERGVAATIEIDSLNVILPSNVLVQINSYGLIGESSVDITPTGSLVSDTQALSPLSPDCNSQIIVCEGDRLQGKSGVQLFQNFARLSEIYSDPKFFNSITGAADSAAEAAKRIGKLSDTLNRLSLTLNREIEGVSDTTDALTKTANESTKLLGNVNNIVANNSINVERTLVSTSELVNNLNELVANNRANLNDTIRNFDRTSQELRELAEDLQTTVAQVNNGLGASDTQKLVQNLETLVANAAETSENLRELSGTLNSPTNALTIQQTLDSARATFENAQKITSDLDDLTGDPAFRNNVRNLVNGLSSLVSSTQQIEQQVRIAQALGGATQQLEQLEDSLRPTQRLQPYHTTVSDKDAITLRVPPRAIAQFSYLELMPQNFSKSSVSSKVASQPLSKPLPHPSRFQLQGALPKN